MQRTGAIAAINNPVRSEFERLKKVKVIFGKLVRWEITLHRLELDYDESVLRGVKFGFFELSFSDSP